MIQHVIFRLDEEEYGLDIASVSEIITPESITRIPEPIWFVEGVINLRGKVIPLVNLRKRFELNKADSTGLTHTIVVELGEQKLGLMVDEVLEVRHLPGEIIESPSVLIKSSAAKYIKGIAKLDDRLIILLEPEELLTRDERASLIPLAERGQ